MSAKGTRTRSAGNKLLISWQTASRELKRMRAYGQRLGYV